MSNQMDGFSVKHTSEGICRPYIIHNILGGIPNISRKQRCIVRMQNSDFPCFLVTHFPPVLAVNSVDGGSTISCPVIVG